MEQEKREQSWILNFLFFLFKSKNFLYQKLLASLETREKRGLRVTNYLLIVYNIVQVHNQHPMFKSDIQIIPP